jgi:hypothetical protein
MSRQQAKSIIRFAALGLLCALTPGCSSSGNEHDVLLREYQKIADRAFSLVQTETPTDPAIVKEVTQLAEKAVTVRHKMLLLPKQPTPQQLQRCEAIAAKLQKALRVACPKCPKG